MNALQAIVRGATVAVLTVVAAPHAFAKLPQRNLTVELRQVEAPASATGGFTVGTRRLARNMQEPQQVQVLNGARATLRLGKSMPLQWVQAAAVYDTSLGAPGAYGSGGGVVYAVTWVEAGRSLTVQPRWPGGKQPVTVDIEVQAAAVDAHAGSELPAQSRGQLVSTVIAPLGLWVTIARIGPGLQPEQAGVYASNSASGEQGQLIQIRVMAPLD
jgi:hypothetical protein